MKPRILRAAVAALALVPLASGCLIGSSENTKFEGRFVSQETLDRVEPVDSQDEVRSLLGSPTRSTTKESGTTIWTYSYTQATTKTGAVFLLFGSSRTTETEGAVYVEFDADGKVLKTWSER